MPTILRMTVLLPENYRDSENYCNGRYVTEDANLIFMRQYLSEARKIVALKYPRWLQFIPQLLAYDSLEVTENEFVEILGKLGLVDKHQEVNFDRDFLHREFNCPPGSNPHFFMFHQVLHLSPRRIVKIRLQKYWRE